MEVAFGLTVVQENEDGNRTLEVAVAAAAAGSKPKVFEGGDEGREGRKIARDLAHVHERLRFSHVTHPPPLYFPKKAPALTNVSGPLSFLSSRVIDFSPRFIGIEAKGIYESENDKPYPTYDQKLARNQIYYSLNPKYSGYHRGGRGDDIKYSRVKGVVVNSSSPFPFSQRDFLPNVNSRRPHFLCGVTGVG